MDDFLETLAAQLKQHEGCQLTMYYDTQHIPTIGYGHNCLEPISLEAAEQLKEGKRPGTISTYYQQVPRRAEALRQLLFSIPSQTEV